MAQKSQGLKKYAFSSAPQLKERNLLDPSSYDFQIRKQNTVSKGAISFNSKVASSVYGRQRSGLFETPGITRGPGIIKASISLSDASSSDHFPPQNGVANQNKNQNQNQNQKQGVLLGSHSMGCLLFRKKRCNIKAKNGSATKATESKGGGFKFSSDTNPVGIRDGEELNRRYFIVGERRISSYWWASVFFLGGLGFLITGISSYIKYNLFTSVYRAIEAFVNSGLQFGAPNLSPDLIGQNSQLLLSLRQPPEAFLIQETGGESLIFFPQGLLLCFYGSLGLLLSLYWWLLIYWNVGGGFNELNKKEGFMRIFRWGYPGKNRRINIVYPLKDIEAIRVELSGNGLLASEQTIFIRLLSTGVDKLKVKREIPLGGIGQPLTLKEIEKQASELANYLQVPLEGL